MRCWCSNFCASSRLVPCGTVTRLSEVIKADSGCCKSVTKRRSRFVRIPASFGPSVMGMPEIR